MRISCMVGLRSGVVASCHTGSVNYNGLKKQLCEAIDQAWDEVYEKGLQMREPDDDEVVEYEAKLDDLYYDLGRVVSSESGA